MATSDLDVKECWYSVLGVERTASPEEIRSAYRKVALKWHPDKIQQSGASAKETEIATKRFQNIAQAYEVLSDPVERAWYDKYRNEILSSGTASKDFEFNVFSFFSPSAFSGFGTSGKGFFKVYRDVFASIHKKEQAFAKSFGLGPIGEAPDLGKPDAPVAEVEEFYKYWVGFVTVKDFSWCDEYQVSQAPNRKVRRLMEEENAKVRKRNRREFNDAVRDLATFVKKRDKRWLDRQAELQRLQKEKEEQFKLKKKLLREERLAKARAFEEQEWAKNPDLDVDVVGDVDEGSYSWTSSNKAKTEEDNLQEFYCIICSKRFRSEKQWKNHEKSKKHAERASALRRSFLDEDEQADALVRDSEVEVETQEEQTGTAAAGLDGVARSEVGDSGEFAQAKRRGNAATTARDSGKKNSGKQRNTDDDNEEEDEDDESLGGEDEESMLAAMMNSHKSRLGVTSPGGDATVDGDSQDILDKSRDQTEGGSSSDSADEEDASHVDDDDDEERLLDSMLKSIGMQSRVSLDKQKSTGEPVDDLSDAEKPEDETEAAPTAGSNQSGSDEETIPASFVKSNGRRKSKAEKQHVASKERHSDLERELSSTSHKSEVVQNGESDVEVQMAPETSVHSGDDREDSAPATNQKKKKLQRGQKKSNLDSSVKQAVQLAGHVSQSSEHMGKKGSMKGKKGKGAAKAPANTCDTCGEDFDSRSQLFRHISATNHASLKMR